MIKTPPELERNVDRLEALLREMLAQHTQLLATMERKRDVMRRADHPAMDALCRLEAETINRISEMEKQRLELVGVLTLYVDANANEPMRLALLAEQLPEPARGRLLIARQQLLEKMRQVQHQTLVARRATESLAKHMTGVIQTIGALKNGVATYGNRGQRPKAVTTMRTINVTA